MEFLVNIKLESKEIYYLFGCHLIDLHSLSLFLAYIFCIRDIDQYIGQILWAVVNQAWLRTLYAIFIGVFGQKRRVLMLLKVLKGKKAKIAKKKISFNFLKFKIFFYNLKCLKYQN